jgi:hypothetical protein
MAETNNEQTQEVQQEVQTETKAPETQELSAKELNDKLQDALTEMARLKRAQEKAASEAADYKKKWKESLSASEQASMEKAEAEAQREEQFNQLLRENTINRIEKNYLGLGWTPDEAARMAVAEVDGDIDTKAKILGEVDARKKKEYEAEFIRTRPDVNIGGGSGVSYTKEQFDNMGIVERTKLKRENPAEYDRLMKL